MVTEDEQFYMLIDTKDVTAVKNFYKINKTNININRIHGDGETALHKAIGIGPNSGRMVRYIMQLRPNLEIQSSKKWTPLHKAVSCNNLEAVSILVAHNANVNSRSREHGKTPLHLAVFNRSTAIARRLLEHHANPNLMITTGQFASYSALHLAVMNNHESMVQLLLQYGINTELRCHYGYSALWLAVLNSYLKIVDFLCGFRANCNAKPTSGTYRNRSPLFAAVELNKLEMVKVLTHHQANVNSRDERGRTPLYLAVYLGYQDIVRFLLANKANVNVHTYFGEHKGSTPLFAAIYNKNQNMVRWLLYNNASVNVKRVDGVTPLHCAVFSGCVAVAKLLIRNRAEVNVPRQRNGNTPLHDAVQLGDLLMVKQLLKNKAQVNVQNHKGQTPIFLAASLGYWKIIEELLKNGADVNICDKNSSSPLHVATRSKKYKTMYQLVYAGAEVNAFDARNQTPFSFALRSNNEEIINFLLKHSAVFTTKCIPENNPAYFKYITDERTLDYLIKQGVDVNQKSTEGETALHRLIQVSVPEVVAFMKTFMELYNTKKDSIQIYNNNEVCDELVYPAVSGFGVHARDMHDFNAIHMAIHKRATDLYKCSLLYGASTFTAVRLATKSELMKDMFLTLIKSGADINCADKLGYTALHLATRCKRYTYMRMLLDNGAQVNVEDRAGCTPLSHAICNGDQDAVAILLEHNATNNILKYQAWKFCDLHHYTMPRVLLQFEYVKQKFVQNGGWAANSQDNTLEGIKQVCKNEIQDLSANFVGNSKLRFINLVTKPVLSLVPFIRNTEIKQVLDTKHFMNLFPIFGDNIKVKANLMFIKNQELMKCKNTLDELFNNMLPCLVMDKIISYLDDDDHKTLLYLYREIV